MAGAAPHAPLPLREVGNTQAGVDPRVVCAITTAAAAQHGAVSTAQLRSTGLSARAQRRLVEVGWLQFVAPTVLVFAGSSDTWYRRLHVGLLALGGRGWVSQEAAARLHGLIARVWVPSSSQSRGVIGGSLAR